MTYGEVDENMLRASNSGYRRFTIALKAESLGGLIRSATMDLRRPTTSGFLAPYVSG